MRQAFVHRLGASAPDDVAPLAAAITDRRLLPAAIIAVLGKTEGNGCVNDFSRGLATAALRRLLEQHLPADMVAEIPLVMSGGHRGRAGAALARARGASRHGRCRAGARRRAGPHAP